MYQALYRKYRPSRFDEVVGQDVIIKTLCNEIVNNKVSHAYLFTGPRGTGKTSVAKILAKTINCTDIQGFSPCNKCVSCTQIDKRQTTDIIEIDAASNNGVDEIRELKSKVNLVPSTSKYKVYIIDEVHMMTVGAFNALLKTLEEPPTHVIFILATTDPQKVPITILSRCQRFDFKRISEIILVKKMSEIIKNEKLTIDSSVLFEIARLSDGGMRDSIGMLDQVISYADAEITIKEVHEVNGTLTQKDLKSFIQAIFDKDLLYLFNNVDIYSANGKNLVKLTEEIIIFLRNILLYKTVPSYLKNNNNDLETYKAFDDISTNHLLKLIQIFNTSLKDMKTTNNAKLLLELIFIQLVDEHEKKEIESSVVSTESVKPLIIVQKEIKKSVEKPIIEVAKSTNVVEVVAKDTNGDFDYVKQIRICNALADFNKKALTQIKNELEEVRTLVLLPSYNQLATLILDGELKAFGNNQLIYVFNDPYSSEKFNSNLQTVEEIICKSTKQPYKAIAVNVEEWNEIKKEFNSKEKKYQFTEETFNIQIFAKKNKQNEQNIESSNDITNLFGSIVKYD